jgi:alpha-glucosidase (family GH31 glycosyl hydrolase)
VGIDIGGFYGSPPPELLIAFYQLGVWYPLMRAHNHHESSWREPWFFSEEVQQVVRESIWLRYTLAHYLMGSFYENQSDGLPVLRPMWYSF